MTIPSDSPVQGLVVHLSGEFLAKLMRRATR